MSIGGFLNTGPPGSPSIKLLSESSQEEDVDWGTGWYLVWFLLDFLVNVPVCVC